MNEQKLKQALKIAAAALDIAADWNLDNVQIEVPKEWKLDACSPESADDGWCSTRSLARKLMELAA